MAESLGKNGEGILPNIEIDSLLLTEDPGDRSIIMYQTQTDLWDERRNFEMSLAYIDNAIPRLTTASTLWKNWLSISSCGNTPSPCAAISCRCAPSTNLTLPPPKLRCSIF